MIISPRDNKSMRMALLYCSDGDKSVGLTSGTFDLLHDYHLKYLERCKRMCDVLVVGVDSDVVVRRIKGSSRPILSEFQRLFMLDSNKHVSFCYVQNSLEDFKKMAETLMPDNGSIFRNQEFEGRENEVVKGSSKANVVIVPDVFEFNSTTSIVNKINSL